MNNITELVTIRASAVPAVPKQLSASQRLRALQLAQWNEDFAQFEIDSGVKRTMLTNAEFLREIASDAKGKV